MEDITHIIYILIFGGFFKTFFNYSELGKYLRLGFDCIHFFEFLLHHYVLLHVRYFRVNKKHLGDDIKAIKLYINILAVQVVGPMMYTRHCIPGIVYTIFLYRRVCLHL